MRMLIGALGLMLSFVLLAVTALAQTVPPETMEQSMTWLGKLVEAVVNGNWEVAGGIGVMIAMVAVRQYGIPKWGIPSEALPLILLVVSSISVIGLGVAGGAKFGDAAYTALEVALISGGLWSLVGKYLTKLILGDKYEKAENATNL